MMGQLYPKQKTWERIDQRLAFNIMWIVQRSEPLPELRLLYPPFSRQGRTIPSHYVNPKGFDARPALLFNWPGRLVSVSAQPRGSLLTIPC